AVLFVNSLPARRRMQTCRICLTAKVISEFPRYFRQKEQITVVESRCRDCRVAHLKQLRESKPEEHAEKLCRYRERRREKGCQQRYYDNNRSRLQEEARIKRAKNPERARQQCADHYQ